MKVAVVGVGTMGAQVLWQLSKRGVDVTGFETYAPGHSRGAAGGENRLFRNIELEEPGYSPIVARADRIWDELQKESGRELRTLTGTLVMGSPQHEQMQTALRNALETGIDHEVLDADALARRFPQYGLDDGDLAILDVRSGFVRPELTVSTAARLAEARGASVVSDTTVIAVKGTRSGAVVTTTEGDHHFDRVIVSAGGWTTKLLPEFREIIETRRLISSWHFAADPNYVPGILPFIRTEPTYCYGIPTVDYTAMKIGLGYSSHLEVDDPDKVERVVRPDELAPFQEIISRYLPGLDLHSMRTETYLETYTASRREWMGPHPDMDNVIVLSGFSGHGFKMCPAIGEIGANLVLGEPSPVDLGFLQKLNTEGPVLTEPASRS
ncbi:N-methyl-L-tryptophan oxidase [Arthrobacter sp. ISL-28]|uniref:N-methyl-L-tryptophan oxidase n=1 Tax=Arthrobacter sp. ISL-28 TaxID=2819108 RepID=UPI001BECCB19|nr:N-methyl-L-tryptophan oxidase [Arthrobacter sp. ISL-28]MBT2520800.1 N-methyl-L-tryptophan oxidase [Arthrobacter sp. ISL-28]